jgi:hypothetical protein
MITDDDIIHNVKRLGDTVDTMGLKRGENHGRRYTMEHCLPIRE